MPLFLVLCLAGVWHLAGPQATEKPGALDVFQLGMNAAPRIAAQVWPGFDPRRYAGLVFDTSTRSYRVTFSNNTSDAKAAIFMSVFDDYYRSHTWEEGLGITVHEAFHGFQRDPSRPGLPWQHENATDLFEYNTSSARNNALFAIEGELLLAALKTTDRSELTIAVRRFLAVRKLRQGELPGRMAAFERGAELNEGLAEYAGTQAVLCYAREVKEEKLQAVGGALKEDAYLLHKYSKLTELSGLGRNARLKFYYTGSAQGLLLDRLMPDWKRAVQYDNQAVQELLQVATAGVVGPAVDVEAIIQERNYPAYLKKEAELASKAQLQTQRQIDALLARPRRIVLELPQSNVVGKNYQSFDPMNVSQTDKGARLHTRMLRIAEGKQYQADFQQPVIEFLDKKQYITALPDDVAVTVDSTAFDPAKAGHIEAKEHLKIASAKLKLEMGPAFVTATEHELVIRPK
jgi:hypothetical protein